MDLFKYNVMTLNNINMIRGDDSPGDNSILNLILVNHFAKFYILDIEKNIFVPFS